MGGIQLAAIIIAVISAGMAVFQVLLTLGYPLGEATMGGFYKVLPKRLRVGSAISAIILLFMGLVFLQHAKLVSNDFHTNVFVWVFTVYLGINSVVNLRSKSKKERVIMTPISSVAFVLCLVVAVH